MVWSGCHHGVRAEQINIQDAKTQLSRIIAEVEAGAEVVVARAGRPVAKIVPITFGVERAPGRLVGRGWIGDDFDDPLPDDVQAAFDGRGA